MAVYSTSNILGGAQVPITASFQTQIFLYQPSANTRAMVQELDLGTVGTPADTYLEYDVSRWLTGTSGTFTAVTPSPMDPAARASSSTARENYTVEPTTYTASLFYLALNQRASSRWLAVPGSELVIPSGQALGLRARGTATTNVSATTIHID